MKNLKVTEIVTEGRKAQLVKLEGYGDSAKWIKFKHNSHNRRLVVGDYVPFYDPENVAKYKEERKQKVDDILAMNVIPTTIENLSIVLEYLNGKNWGSWELPQMSIGYRAAQYDCDGKQITTITLSRPIECCEELTRKFKSGNKRGHLESYIAI